VEGGKRKASSSTKVLVKVVDFYYMAVHSEYMQVFPGRQWYALSVRTVQSSHSVLLPFGTF